MRFDDCDLCEGGKEIIETPMGRIPAIHVRDDIERMETLRVQGRVKPCPRCQDDDGNPTGRVLIASDEELDVMAALYDQIDPCCLTPQEKRIMDALTAELAHRKEGGKG